MTIRPATRQDLAGIMALESGFPAGQRWSEASWLGELEGDRRVTLVAREGGDVVGAATFELGPDAADLHRIVVAADHRRRGVADALMVAGIARVPGRILLEVRHDNEPALRLYAKHGFRVIDRRRDYYGVGIDALVHEREEQR